MNVPKVNRIGRRDALKRVGTLAAVPVLSAYHPLVPVQPGGAPWRPRWLTPTEATLVGDLAELIIPQTETPGAKAANVHQYIDLVVSQGSQQSQQAFRRGLERFAGVDEARQIEMLGQGGSFFDELKELTVDGYYKSEIGMKEELGYEGRTFVTVFEGCTHEEHLNWTPASPSTKSADEA